MPTSVDTSSASRSVSHSAIPRRVQYLRGDGGGGTRCRRRRNAGMRRVSLGRKADIHQLADHRVPRRAVAMTLPRRLRLQ
jgi:hypothetical protein